MSYLTLQQTNFTSIHVVPPDKNMDTFSGQVQFYFVLSWLFPVIALILLAITIANSRIRRPEESMKLRANSKLVNGCTIAPHLMTDNHLYVKKNQR